MALPQVTGSQRDEKPRNTSSRTALRFVLGQTGTFFGSLLVPAILAFRKTYRFAFAALSISTTIRLSMVQNARHIYPSPHDLKGNPQ